MRCPFCGGSEDKVIETRVSMTLSSDTPQNGQRIGRSFLAPQSPL